MHVVLLHGNGACRENKCIFKKKTPHHTHTYTHHTTHTPTHTHTHHTHIKSYLYKCKIIDNSQSQCKNGDQTVQHTIFECTIFDQERDELKAVVMRTENLPVSFNKLSTIYYKNFKEYIDSIIWDND